MAVSANKLAPSVVVLAITGYCIWPSTSALIWPPQAPPPPTKKEPLSKSLFTRELPPVPIRNPWGGLSSEELATARELAKSQEAPKVVVTETNGKGKKEITAVDPLASLKLEATSILGDQRIALINDHEYTAKQTVGADGSSSPFKVVIVLPHKVLLERQGRIYELTFPSAAKSSAHLQKTQDAVAKDTASRAEGDAVETQDKSPANLLKAMFGGKLPAGN